MSLLNEMASPYTKDDANYLFHVIGEAVWYLQHLEHGVSTFIALKILQRKKEKGTKITEKIAQQILNKQRGQTLGPLIGTAKREKTIPKSLVNRFDSFLFERNWLIHKCVVNEYLALRNENRKNELFRRIEEFAKEAQYLRNEVNKLMRSWYTSYGYDLGYAYTLAEQEIRNAEKS